jgi:hypothetical protein
MFIRFNSIQHLSNVRCCMHMDGYCHRKECVLTKQPIIIFLFLSLQFYSIAILTMYSKQPIIFRTEL